MVDAVVNAGVVKVGREGRQLAKFIPDPRIRAKAFAAVSPNPPTLSVSSTSQLPAGSIRRQPEEFRVTNTRPYHDAGLVQWVSSQSANHRIRGRKSYGYQGDLTPTEAAPKPGDALLRFEFDIRTATGDFEIVILRNSSLQRIWVDEQPATAYPIKMVGTPNDNSDVFLLFSGLTPGYHRIQFDMEQSLPGLNGMIHRAADDIFPPMLSSKGRLMTLGDSIWQAGTALMGDPAPPNAQQYYSGGFVINMGYLLGLHDVLGGYNQGGTGLVHNSAGTGNRNFIDRIPVDIIPAKPDSVLIGCSSNDATTPEEAAMVGAALGTAVQMIKAGLPDCIVIGVGPLTVPPAPAWGGSSMTTVVQQFIAGCAATNIPYVDTAGIFTGTRLAGGAANGSGNADMYTSALAADVAVNAPHPNQAGHDRIAKVLAPRVARLLQIDMSEQPAVAGNPTSSGYWES